MGESVTAFAVLRAGANLDLDELRGWATERLARYKLPTRLEIIEDAAAQSGRQGAEIRTSWPLPALGSIKDRVR